jgi:hypothetical protein
MEMDGEKWRVCFQSKWPGGADGGKSSSSTSNSDGGPCNRPKDEGAGNGRWRSTHTWTHEGELWRSLLP